MIKKICFPLLFLIFNTSFAADATIYDTQIHINTIKEQVIIISKSYGDFSLKLSKLPLLNNKYLEFNPIHILKKQKRVYLLMSALFPSRPGATKGRCAAGDEYYLLWLAFDEKHELLNSQYESYNSCLFSLENKNPISIGYTDEFNGLSITIFDVMSDKKHRLIYDLKRPQQGLLIDEL